MRLLTRAMLELIVLGACQYRVFSLGRLRSSFSSMAPPSTFMIEPARKSPPTLPPLNPPPRLLYVLAADVHVHDPKPRLPDLAGVERPAGETDRSWNRRPRTRYPLHVCTRHPEPLVPFELPATSHATFPFLRPL